MHHIDRNPEFSESSSSSPEAIPPDRQHEMARSASSIPSGSTPFDPNQEISGSYHGASEQDSALSTDSSQAPTKHRSLWRASYLAVASAIIAALLIGGLVGWLLGQHNPGAKGTD